MRRKGRRIGKISIWKVRENIGAFLAEHGFESIPLQDKSFRWMANYLEGLAGLPNSERTQLRAKRRITLAMVKLREQSVGPLPKRFSKALHRVNVGASKVTADSASKFYASRAWKVLRYRMLVKYGRKCMSCGEKNGIFHVDHIKPLRKYWELRLDENNLQVLCADCNLGKGNTDETDWRLEAER